MPRGRSRRRADQGAVLGTNDELTNDEGTSDRRRSDDGRTALVAVVCALGVRRARGARTVRAAPVTRPVRRTRLRPPVVASRRSRSATTSSRSSPRWAATRAPVTARRRARTASASRCAATIPAADYDTITRQAGGRRVNKLEPAKSLILLKPTEAVPHVGGKKFEAGSPDYQVLARVDCRRACRRRATADARLVRLDVTPGAPDARGRRDARRCACARTSPTAHAEDVTRWARFATADETVAHVDERRRASRVKGPGETAISGRASSPASRWRASARRSRSPVPDATYAQRRAAQLHRRARCCDKLRAAAHPAVAAVRATTTFIRRAYPRRGRHPADARRGRARSSRTPRPTSARGSWTRCSSATSSSTTGPTSGRTCCSSRAGRSAATTSAPSTAGSARRSQPNMPWDRFVYALTTATGRTDENGAANYFLIHRNPIDLAENYTQAFLGLTLTCARCHNHPMEKWTQMRLLRVREPLRARLDEGRRRRRGKSDTATVVSTPDGDDPAPAARRWRCRRAARRHADAGAFDGGPARVPRRTGSPAPANTLFARDGRQPRLGELLRPRPGAPGRRPALHQPGVERAAASRR